MNSTLRKSLIIGAIIVVWLLATVIFSLAYTQSPLYEGNQNTKFLHGLAMAGKGYLQQDWLANTIDPLPVFTYLVYLTARVNENLFYFQYALIFGLYILGIMGILSTLYKDRWTLTKQVAFFTLFLLIHSRHAIIRIEKVYDFNIEFLQNGLAGQYLLGIEYQNSAFGVFILLSIFAFLKNKYYLAALFLGIATLFHSAYLFSAGLITIAYLMLIFLDNVKASNAWQERSFPKIIQAVKQPFFLGLFTTILVLPVIWHNQVYLGATSPETQATALDLMIHERIPHHALVSSFWNNTHYIQVGIILVGLILAYRSRLFVIMLSLALGGLIFSVIQVVMDSDSLALMAPWRVSVLLVPLSVSLIIAFIVSSLIDLLHMNNPKFLFLFVPLLLYVVFINVRGGLELQDIYGSGRKERRLVQMMDTVKKEKQPGDLYMVPPEDNLFDDFRIFTGAPTFITWKSHPYKDVEFLEWYKRVEQGDRFFKSGGEDKCNQLKALVSEYGITHVVFKSKEVPLYCDFAQEIHRIENFVIYKINQ